MRVVPFTPLCTPRLKLEALDLEHADALFELASDPEISARVAWPRHERIADSRQTIARSLIAHARGGHYEWALLRTSDRAFIGTCGLAEPDAGRDVTEL